MPADLNIFNLDFGNLAKLMNKGRVDKVYFKMYAVAEKLAIHETKKYLFELQAKISSIKSDMDLLTMITDYRKDRISFHMDEMKKLLEMSLKAQLKEKMI